MTPAQEMIRQAAADGVLLQLAAGGVIEVTGDGEIVSRWSAIIREHKPALVAALSEPVSGAEPESPAAIDFEPGWRRRASLQQWELEWRPVWQHWRDYLASNPGQPCPSRAVSLRQIGELVIAWNCVTGDRRTVADVTCWLGDEDFAGRELMQPGSLALHLRALFAEEG